MSNKVIEPVAGVRSSQGTKYNIYRLTLEPTGGMVRLILAEYSTKGSAGDNLVAVPLTNEEVLVLIKNLTEILLEKP